MKKIWIQSLLILISFGAIIGCNRGEKEKINDSSKTDSVSKETQNFFKATAEACLVNIEQTRMCVEKCALPELRKISSEVNVQQKNLMNELRDLAAMKNISMPDSLNGIQRRRIAALDSLKIDLLDKRLMSRIAFEIRNEVKAFKTVETTTDSDIKGFVLRNFPEIQAEADTLRSFRRREFPATQTRSKKSKAVKK
jgi:putative membrane protein